MSLLSLSPYSAELALTELLSEATHLALFTADPIVAGSLASEQADANGYSRQAITWTSAGGAEEATSAEIVFSASGAAWTGPWYVCAMNSGTHGVGNVIAVAVWEAGTPNEGQPWTTFDRAGISAVPDGGKLIVPIGDLIFAVGAVPDVPALDPVAEVLAMGPALFWLFDRAEYESVQLLYQDDAATTPVTSNGDPVGCAKDLVLGREAIQSTSGRRPTYAAGVGIEFAGNGELFAGDLTAFVPNGAAAPSVNTDPRFSYGTGFVVNDDDTYRHIIVNLANSSSGNIVVNQEDDWGVQPSNTVAQDVRVATAQQAANSRLDCWYNGSFARAPLYCAQTGGVAFRNVAGNWNADSVVFGNYQPGNASYMMTGTISYVVFFDRLLTIPEMAKLQQMLMRIGQ